MNGIETTRVATAVAEKRRREEDDSCSSSDSDNAVSGAQHHHHHRHGNHRQSEPNPNNKDNPSPRKTLTRLWHPTQELRKRARSSEDEDTIASTVNFLLSEAKELGCRSRTGSTKPLKCRCLSFFTDADPSVARAVAKFIVVFGTKKKADRQRIVMHWIRNTSEARKTLKETHVIYPIPYQDITELSGIGLETLLEAKICQSALMSVAGIGRAFWTTCVKAVEGGGVVKEHGLKGKASNRASSDVNAAQAAFLEKLKLSAEVHEESGSLMLPVSYSKRNLYQKFCWERGHNVRYTAVGIAIIVDRNDDEWLQSHSADEPALKIGSWTAFRNYWNNHYPELNVQRPSRKLIAENADSADVDAA